MLVLTRRPKQSIFIGEDIRIEVVEVNGNNVKISIDAPKDKVILRGEIEKSIEIENKNFVLGSENINNILK